MMKIILFTALTLIAMGTFTGCYYDNKSDMYGAAVCDTMNPTYSATIEPMISQNCIGCHDGSGGSGGVSLSTYEAVKAEALNGRLEGVVNHSGAYYQMPPSGQLSTCKLNQIAKWVRQGMPQ